VNLVQPGHRVEIIPNEKVSASPNSIRPRSRSRGALQSKSKPNTPELKIQEERKEVPTSERKIIEWMERFNNAVTKRRTALNQQMQALTEDQ
jgi:hypothetical protein